MATPAHTATERAAAYRAVDTIKEHDVDARLLKVDQVQVLMNWCDWQACSTFEDRAGNQFPLQAILDLYHASIVYETFDSWHSEEPRAARKAYVAVCKKHGIKHGAAA